MFCGKCGNKIEATDKFCPFCGAPAEKPETIEEVKQEATAPAPVSPGTGGYAVRPESPKKAKKQLSRREKTIIGCTAGAVVIIALVTVLVLILGGGVNKPYYMSADSTDELEEMIAEDVSKTISALKAECKSLTAEIDTYSAYKKNVGKVEAFYNKILNETKALCLRMRECSLRYAELVMAADTSIDDKYDDIDGIYDCIYDDALDDIRDDIYDGIIDDMRDAFYDGILDDARDTVPYDEWSDVIDAEYDLWSDYCDDVYDEYSDCSDDIYDFWSNMSSELGDEDIAGAEKETEDFRADIEKLKLRRMQTN